MAPAADQLSTPGAATYNSDHMHVGDGTWDFTKNTFLLPNLQGLNFDTMRINGMGNRFSTVQQYHTLILAHGILMAAVFMFLLPTSVMLARFYSREPGYAVRYHAQLNIFSAVLLVAAFILPFFAVGHPRSLTNPHHGIGVAIFTLFLVQILGGSFVRYITKIRSLRIMIHQWLGRTTALLGIVQIPLGLTLYGSPKVLFVLYALWMGFLFVVYFVLCYQSESRREIYMSGPRSEMRSEVRSEVRSDLRSEDGRTRMTESEYFSEHDENHHSKLKWLGPLAAAAGLFALLKSRKKRRDGDTYNRSRSRSRSRSPSRRPTDLSSRPPSGYYGGEKYSDMPHERSERGGGGAWTRILATMGLARLFSGFRRNNDRDDLYSAVSTETPYRQRSERATTISEFNSEYTDDASTIPPSHHPAGTAAMSADMESRIPRQTMRGMDDPPRRGFPDESEYSSYVSPSRRQPQPGPSSGNGFARGIWSGLGLGWVSRRISGRRARKEEERMQDEDDYHSVTEYQRQTREGDSPPRRGSQRRQPSGRRYTATGTETALSEITESSFVSRPHERSGRPTTPSDLESTIPPASTAPPSRSRNEPEYLHGGARSEVTDATSRPDRRETSRRRRHSERAAAAAAARASSLAAAERDQFGSPTSQPVSVQLKIHDDKDRNLTLRRLTEDEIAAARERGDSEMSSILDSPTHGRRYRRDSSQRRAEDAAERRAESDGDESTLSPPHPSFAKGGGRRNRDSAYFAGQPGGPSNLAPPTAAASMVSSVRSHGTWSGMSMSPSQPMSTTKAAAESAAADNRRRRRQERRRTSSSRPSVD